MDLGDEIMCEKCASMMLLKHYRNTRIGKITFTDWNIHNVSKGMFYC